VYLHSQGLRLWPSRSIYLSVAFSIHLIGLWARALKPNHISDIKHDFQLEKRYISVSMDFKLCSTWIHGLQHLISADKFYYIYDRKYNHTKVTLIFVLFLWSVYLGNNVFVFNYDVVESSQVIVNSSTRPLECWMAKGLKTFASELHQSIVLLKKKLKKPRCERLKWGIIKKIHANNETGVTAN
jgi:uncharacterized membrane protein